MKTILKIIALALVLQSFQCSKSDKKNSNEVTAEQLKTKKQEIVDYINSVSCSETEGCNSIAFGTKPCGGPREYLLFPNNVNLSQLEKLVHFYNDLDSKYNIQTNAVSDCSLALPPTDVSCINGVCKVIK
jgi:hypothetical protein